MGIKLTNNAFGTLAAGINSSATSITLTSGQGARFPTLSGGDFFYATLVDTSNNLEIVKCTARSTDVLTVVRAQESTTARAYNTGDRIEIRLTAQTFLDAVNEIGPTQVSDEANTSTGYFDLPVGTTAQRPGTPTFGMIRANSTTGLPEWYDETNTLWKPFNVGITYTIEYLLVAGGGGGGSDRAGGGGAGGYINSSSLLQKSASYPVVIGAGGSGGQGDEVRGSNGANSTAFDTTAIGGGGGGCQSFQNGLSGGSGGGASGSDGSTGTPGSGTSGQGFAGGNGYAAGAAGRSGGGGGATATGGNATSTNGGNGGAGINWLSLGTTYAGGGGGGIDGRLMGTVGSGGAGDRKSVV
jgi:hypothetical protein